MSIASFALDFANAANLLGVLLLMRSVVRDRKVLKGFSVTGCLLTFVAVLSFEIAYVFMEIWVSFVLGLVSLIFWFFAFIFSFRKFLAERRNLEKFKLSK